MAIMIKSPAEIEKMRHAGRLLRELHNHIAPLVVPGASTMDLEEAAVAKSAELRAIPAFKGYHGFPYALCTSINEEVVHGMPNAKRILKQGDILSIDAGLIVDGFYSDAAVTYAIGTPTPAVAKLLEITKQSLDRAIAAAQVGGRLGDISFAVQELCEAAGLRSRQGVRRPRHRQADARRPSGPQLRPKAAKAPASKPAWSFAIEPMINAGKPEVKVLPDGWTAVTVDGSYSAHFEHTVAITKDGPQVLTR